VNEKVLASVSICFYSVGMTVGHYLWLFITQLSLKNSVIMRILVSGSIASLTMYKWH
jgi:hypothetical protein